MSEKQGEQFHQDFKTMEDCYQVLWEKYMMAGYCRSINRDDSGKAYKRKSNKQKFLSNEIFFIKQYCRQHHLKLKFFLQIYKSLLE